MSEGEKEKKTFPPGFRFTPTDDELIEYYLLPRLQGRQHVPNDAIIDDNVYRCHPDDLVLNGEYKNRGQDGSWYFVCSRTRKYGNGHRPSRSTDDGRGRWKALSGCGSAVTAGRNIPYSFSVLNYFEGPSYKEEDKGDWLMRELTVPLYENKLADTSKRKTLDEFVVCKMYMTKRGKKKRDKQADEAGSSGTNEETCPAASQIVPVETGQETAKRRKGETPIDVEAATPKQELPAPAPDQCLGPQAARPRPTQSLCGGATQARFGATGYHHHYGGAGRPVAYNPHTSMPRPPMAFAGHQAPAYRAAPVASPGYFGQTTTTRHLAPAGQSSRPPRPPTVPSYPVMQRQPETEEMRERRVYQQLINELMMMRRRMQQQQQQQQSGNVAYPAQQPMPMASMQQQPCFGAGFSHQHVRPMGPPFLPYNNRQPVQCSYPATDFGSGAAATTTLAENGAGSVGGATNEGIDNTGGCMNDEKRLCGGFD